MQKNTIALFKSTSDRRGHGRAAFGLRRVTAAALALSYFWVHVGAAHADERSYWEERRRARAMSGQSIARLPAEGSARDLFRYMPAAAPVPLRSVSAPVASMGGAGRTTAAPLDWLTDVVMPYGAVREVHRSAAPGSPLVIHIQDAHELENAQRNIGAIVEGLRAKRGVTLVGLEGARAAVEVAPFGPTRRADLRRAVAEILLRRGYIGGAEHAALVSVTPPALWGIENAADYRANIEAVTESRRLRPLAEGRVRDLLRAAEGLKDKIYGPAMREFDRRLQNHAARREGLNVFVPYLLSVLPAGETVPPNVSLLRDVIKTEEDLNFRTVETERLSLVESLAARLTPAELETLLKDSLALKMDRLSFGAYQQRLIALCRAHGLDLDRRRALVAYMAYVDRAERIDKDALLSELGDLQENLPRRLSARAEERRLADVLRRLDLLRRLTANEMSPVDWGRYLADRPGVLGVAGELRSLGATIEGTVEESLLLPFERFCEAALRRNEGLLNNLLDKMRAEKVDSAVLVAGGFHTRDLTERMRRAGVSYVVVSPKIATAPENPGALAAFARDPLPLERLLAGERIGVNYPRLSPGNELVNAVPGATVRRDSALVIANAVPAAVDPGSLVGERTKVVSDPSKDGATPQRSITVTTDAGQTVRLASAVTETDTLPPGMDPGALLLRETVSLPEGTRTVVLARARRGFSGLTGVWGWLTRRFRSVTVSVPAPAPSSAPADSFIGEWPPRVDPRSVPILDYYRTPMSNALSQLTTTLARLETSPPDLSGLPNDERDALSALLTDMRTALKDFADGRDVYGAYDAWELERNHPGYLNHGAGLPWEASPERKPRLLLLDQRFFDGRSLLARHTEQAAFHEVGHAVGSAGREPAHLRLLRLQAIVYWGVSPREAYALDLAGLEKHPQNKLGRALREDRIARALWGADKIGALHAAIKDRVGDSGTLVRWFVELNEVIVQLSRQEKRPFESVAGPLLQAIEQLRPRPTLEFYRAIRERADADPEFRAMPLAGFVLHLSENQNNEVRDLVAAVLRQLGEAKNGLTGELLSAADRLSGVANGLETTATFNSEEIFWKSGVRREAVYAAETRRLSLAEDFLVESRTYAINDQIAETLRSSLWPHRGEQVLKTLGEAAGLDPATVLRLRAVLFWGLSPEEALATAPDRLAVHAANALDRAVRVWTLAWWLREDVGVYELRDRLRDFLRRRDGPGLIAYLQEVDDATKIDLPIGNGTWMQKQAALGDAIRRARSDRRLPERDEALTEVVFRATAMNRAMPVEAAYPLMKAVALLTAEEEEALLRTIEKNHKSHPDSYRTHGLLLAPLLMAGRIPQSYVEDMDFTFNEVVEVSPEGFRLWGGGLGPVESYILLAYARLVSAVQRFRGSLLGAPRRGFSVVGMEPDYLYKRGPEGNLVRLSDDALSQKLDFTDSQTHYIRVPAPILTRESEFGHVQDWVLKTVLVRVRTAKNQAGGTVLLWRDLWSSEAGETVDENAAGFDPDRLETRFAKTLYAYRQPGQNNNDEAAKKELFNPETEWSFSAFHGALATVLLADRETKRRAAMGPRWTPAPLVLNDAQSSLIALLIKRPDGFRTELTDALDKGPYGEMLRLLRRYMVVAMKTHTYANRQYFDVYEPRGDSDWGKRMAMFLVGMRDEGDFPRLKKIHLRRRPIKDGAQAFFDLTSSALRAATLQLSVAANHAANVWRMYGDRVIGMTNGSNFEAVLDSFKGLFRGGDPLRPAADEMRDYKNSVKARFFENLLGGDTLSSAYREELRAFFQADGKWNEGVLRPVVGHVGRLVQVKFGKILSSAENPNVPDPAKDRAWTEENIRAWLRDGANVVILGKVQANPESPKMRDWLLDLQRRISEEWKDETAGWDREKHGRLIFLPAASTELQELLADSIDLFVFDSEENTEAAGFTEAARGKSIYVVPPNPKGEGLFDNQGLPLEGQDGNFVKPEDTSPAAYRRVVSDLLKIHRDSPVDFHAHLANSWRLYRITNVLWTAQANLSVLNEASTALNRQRRIDAVRPRRVTVLDRDWIERGGTNANLLRIAVEVPRDGRGEDLRVRLVYSRVGNFNSAGQREWLNLQRVDMPLKTDGEGRKEFELDLKTLNLAAGDYEFTVIAFPRQEGDESRSVQMEGVRFGVNGRFAVPSETGAGTLNSPVMVGTILSVFWLPGAGALLVGAAVLALSPAFRSWAGGAVSRIAAGLRSWLISRRSGGSFGGKPGEFSSTGAPARQALSLHLLGGAARRLDIGSFELDAAALRAESLRELREAEDGRRPFESFLAAKAKTIPSVPVEVARMLLAELAEAHRSGRLIEESGADSPGAVNRQLTQTFLYIARLAGKASDENALAALRAGADAYNRAMGLEVLGETDLAAALDNGRWIGLQLTANVIEGRLETEEDRRVGARLDSLSRLIGADPTRGQRVVFLAPENFRGADVTSRLAGQRARASLAGVAVLFENDVAAGIGEKDGLLSAQQFIRVAQKRSVLTALDPMDLLILDPSRWRVEESVKGLAKLLVLLTGDLVVNATEGIGEDIRFLQYVRINA